MIWVDVQRMQILPWQPDVNHGEPHTRLNAFLNDGTRVQEDFLRFESFEAVPVIHYFTQDEEFVGSLRAMYDISSKCGWKPIITTEQVFVHNEVCHRWLHHT